MARAIGDHARSVVQRPLREHQTLVSLLLLKTQIRPGSALPLLTRGGVSLIKGSPFGILDFRMSFFDKIQHLQMFEPSEAK